VKCTCVVPWLKDAIGPIAADEDNLVVVGMVLGDRQEAALQKERDFYGTTSSGSQPLGQRGSSTVMRQIGRSSMYFVTQTRKRTLPTETVRSDNIRWSQWT
jgi:hypothetical protein